MSFANSSIIRDHLLVDIDRLVRLHMDSWTDRVLLMEEAKKVISPIYFDYFLVSYTWTTSCLPELTHWQIVRLNSLFINI